jgi:hypothetical protein
MFKTQSASGHSSKVNSPFNQPEVLELVSLKAELESITPFIAKAGIIDSPRYVGQTIYVINEPDGLSWKPYEANQAMEADQVTPTGECITIDHTNYALLKVDNSEKHILGNDYQGYYDRVIAKTAKKLAPMYDKFTLGMQILAATPNMRGNKAGRYGDVNLGSIGNPFILNKDNVVMFFSRLNALFDTYGYSREEKFLVVPPEMAPILVNSPLASYCHVGEKFGIMTSEYELPPSIMGFNLISSSVIEATLDPSKGEQIHYLVAGVSKATAFGGSVVEADSVDMEDAFGRKFRFQEVHGGKVIDPEAIAVSVVKFDYS